MKLLSDPENFLFFGLARHGLVSLFEKLELKDQDVVVLPEFICSDVVSVANQFNAKVLYYPVNEQLMPVFLPNVLIAKVILAVNYFGFPQDLTLFSQFCEKTKAILIEDNAHGFLSKDEAGNYLGTRGNFGLFSFRKTIHIPDGGGLLINAGGGLDFTSQRMQLSHERRPYAFVLKECFNFIQKYFRIPIRTISEALIRFIRVRSTRITLNSGNTEREQYIPKPMRISSFNKLTKINETKESDRRRKLFVEMKEFIKIDGGVPVWDKIPFNTVPNGFPFYASDSVAKEIKSKVRKLGLECIKWPDLPANIKDKHIFHYENLYLVNFY